MSRESTSFNLDPDKLARLWDIGAKDNKPDSDTSPSDGDKPNIAGYEVLEKIGQGGMGTVWKAVQLSTQRQVALKVMSSGIFGSDKHLSRFEKEVEFTARLNHPNIVRIYDSGLCHGWYFYAMELIEGRTLDQYIEQVNPDRKEIMKLSHGICRAVSHAHQSGIIHRDLKPSNILVSQDGQPHVLDFGLAKAVGPDAANYTVSVSGEVKGTLEYMSPEQAMGKSQIDIRSDIYSLGFIMYKLLLKQPPYPIDMLSPEDVYRTIRLTEPQTPRKLVRHFDSDLETILLKSLEKEPSRRYQSASELAYDIECWLNGLPIVAKSSSSVYLLRKLITKHRYTSTVAFLLLVILVSGVLVSLYFYNDARAANVQLQDIAQKWEAESADNLLLARRVLFLSFLQAWQTDNLPQAKAVALWLSKDSKEAKGVMFLLSDKPVSERLEDLQKSLPEDQLWFADFIAAQYYLKSNNKEKAEAALVKSSRAMNNSKDQSWYASQIQAALDALKAAGQPAADIPSSQTENQ